MLVDLGLVTEDKIDLALKVQKRTQERIGQIMERLGWRYGTHRHPDTGKTVKGYRRPSDGAAV